MPVEKWDGDVISAEEFDRLQDLYGPLAEAVRELIDATVRTGADEGAIAAATAAVRAVTESLRPLNDGWQPLRHAETGRPVLFTNPAAGWRNPIAPPMVVEHDADGRCWSDFTLGAAYEGPPGCVHGGYVAAVFDELLGATQSLSGDQGMTAHLGVDYRRPTPLGAPLRLEGWLDRRDGRKIYAKGALYSGDELTAEADGLFIAFDREKFAALLAARNDAEQG